MRYTKRLAAAIALLTSQALTQTLIDLRTQSKNPDFSAALETKPFRTGTSLPSTCTVGSVYFKTDAPAGQNWYGCVTANAWTLQGGAGTGWQVGAPLPVTCAVGTAFFSTSASAGQNWYGCTGANTWTLLGNQAPWAVGVGLPSNCTIGSTFFRTDASPGENWYGCTAANTWTRLGVNGRDPSLVPSLPEVSGLLPSSTVRIGASCVTKACTSGWGANTVAYADAPAVQITSQVSAATIRFYLDVNGNRTVQFDPTAVTLSLNPGLTANTSGSGYPAGTQALASCLAIGNVFLQCTDDRALRSWIPVSTNGTIAISPTSTGFDFSANASVPHIYLLPVGYCSASGAVVAGPVQGLLTSQQLSCQDGSAFLQIAGTDSNGVVFELACPERLTTGSVRVSLQAYAQQTGAADLKLAFTKIAAGSYDPFAPPAYGSEAALAVSPAFAVQGTVVQSFVWNTIDLPACVAGDVVRFRAHRTPSANNGLLSARSVVLTYGTN